MSLQELLLLCMHFTIFLGVAVQFGVVDCVRWCTYCTCSAGSWVQSVAYAQHRGILMHVHTYVCMYVCISWYCLCTYIVGAVNGVHCCIFTCTVGFLKTT